MSGLLRESRVPVSLLPGRLIVEAARDEGVRLEEPGLMPSDVLEEPGLAERVLGRAVERWRDIAPSWMRLNFTMQRQLQTQWCWAATSVSVSEYYDPDTHWSQCTMVNAEKELTTCCRDGSSEDCDTPNVLDAPLSRADVLDHKQTGSVGYDIIRREIDAGRPLAWRIRWSGGGGHFAVIEGYQSFGDEWVAIDDPLYGASDLPVSTLTGGSYQGTGSWSHTYFTRPQSIRRLEPDELRAALDSRARVHPEGSTVVGDGG